MMNLFGLKYDERSSSCLVDSRGYPCGWKGQRGEWKVYLGDKEVQAHRVIWELHFGPIPANLIIDHIDGNPSNNLVNNLRLANKSQNAMNSKLFSTNKSGHKGVSKCNKGWRVQLTKDRKAHGFGVYHDYELACLVADEAREKLHGRFAKHG